MMFLSLPLKNTVISIDIIESYENPIPERYLLAIPERLN